MHFLIKFTAIIFLVLTINFSPRISMAADVNQELMSQAEEAFKKGDFQGAQKLYSALIGNHVIHNSNPSAYLYNLATMAAKAENFGFAYGLLLQAQKLSPFDRDIATNLSFVRAHIDPQALAIHPAGLDPLLLPSALQKYSLLFFALGLASLLFLFLPLWKSQDHPTMKYSMSFLTIFFLALYFLFSALSKTDTGVFIEKQTTLRSGPSTSFPDLMTVPSGARVKISERSNDWYKLDFVSDLNPGKEIIGWVEQGAVLSLNHNSFITAPSLF